MRIDISIIIPVYNSMKYIGECIESALLQSYKNIEVIIIDDASTDQSSEIIAMYAEKNRDVITVVRLEKNSKQGTARNIGVNLAKGKYILFLDSDDLLDYDTCELLYKEAVDKNADIVFCDYLQFGDGIEEYCSHVSKLYMGILDVNKKKALLTTSVVPWAKLIRKNMILENQLYFPERKFYEDQATTYLYYLYADCVSKVEKDLYKYRIVHESTTNGKNQLYHIQSLEMSQLLISRLKHRGFYNIYKQEIEYFAIEQMYCMAIERAMIQFDIFPIQYAEDLLDTLKKEFPNFLNNIYYKNYMSERRKMLVQMHLKSVEDLLYYIQWKYLEVCPNYISNLYMYDIKMSKLKKIIENRQFEIALWGAGKYGQLFIDFFNKCGVEIKKIFDKNLQLVGEQYGKFLIEDYRTTSSDILIFIPFENWVGSIKKLLHENNINVYILNFEVYIKHNLEDCIEEI